MSDVNGAAVPTREVFWNISPAGVAVMYALVVVAAGIFAYGVWRHVREWRRGQPVDRLRPVGPRLVAVARHVLAHGRLLADRMSGIYHLAFFWGFVFLFAGTTVVFLHHDLGWRIMQGRFYLYFQSALLDLMGLVAVAGVVAALVARYGLRLPRLRRGVLSDGLILGLFLSVLVTGFVVEGLRISATDDPWGLWSWVGYGVASLAEALGPGEGTLRAVHATLWWVHFLLSVGFLAYIPYSKLFHLVLAPANVYLQPLRAPAAPRPLDLEKAEHLGAAGFSDLTWKDLFDLDVCTECGRCTAACPAYLTGKPLSPMHLILDLQASLHRPADRRLLAGEVIRPETLWACTTCMACMEACPVFIEHVPKIVDLRRHLVMEQSSGPEGMLEALRGLEVRGHPFRGATASRSDWYRGLEVEQLQAPGSAARVDLVYWAGCAATFDARSQQVARAVVTLLRRAGLRVGVLGPLEQCTGDPARRMGHEFLFQTLARANVETLQQLGVRQVVTACPHCFNTLKNEYPAFGAEVEVRHHTQVLAELVASGRLAPGTAGEPRRVTFHDPCYLGRYNRLFDPPRQLLDRLQGIQRLEMARSGPTSLCCGAGGGRAWVEEPAHERVSHVRAREAVETGADTVAVGCPFCLAMLEDAVRGAAGNGAVQVVDVAELLEQATRPEPAALPSGQAFPDGDSAQRGA